ncbi:MAG: hypothetical protein Q8891_14865 [Bacteroidota bacterium]|nr:hypothetical protein [Bacteroidota bacterium]
MTDCKVARHFILEIIIRLGSWHKKPYRTSISCATDRGIVMGDSGTL